MAIEIMAAEIEIDADNRDHAIKVLGDRMEGELCIVRGRTPFLWVGPENDRVGAIYTFSNPDVLRKIARTILKELRKR